MVWCTPPDYRAKGNLAAADSAIGCAGSSRQPWQFGEHEDLANGQVIHRIHRKVYGSSQFNPGKGNGYHDRMIGPSLLCFSAIASPQQIFPQRELFGGGEVFSVGSIPFSGAIAWNGFDNNAARLVDNVLRRFVEG